MKIAVVGGGWAGIAAAVRAAEAGHGVILYEMAPHLGGRARSVLGQEPALDNGQHILIGAYTRTLALLRTVGCDVEHALARQPLELCYADGRGLRLPPGPSWLSFLRGVAGARGWTRREGIAFVAAAVGWALRGFRCDASLTVAQLCAGLPGAVRHLLIDPLCVAALNTPAEQASASVLLRVLRDALFGGRGASDLLLPRRGLSELLPRPAEAWLHGQGATVRLRHRVRVIGRAAGGWQVDGEPSDAVVLACPPAEAARLAAPLLPAWSEVAAALRYEPIITVYVRARGARLPAPMTALLDAGNAPAQFAFDHGALGGEPGLFAFVVSGARAWLERGVDAAVDAVRAQAAALLPAPEKGMLPEVLRVLVERRATFRCTPGLRRPKALLAPGLRAAGDYVEGPYPSTLEGAVRSGEQAVHGFGRPGPA